MPVRLVPVTFTRLFVNAFGLKNEPVPSTKLTASPLITPSKLPALSVAKVVPS